jgi:hypothetical protein
MPEYHAILGPSSYHRWSACPGSVEAEAPLPNESSEFASEGTAMHELAAIILRNSFLSGTLPVP